MKIFLDETITYSDWKRKNRAIEHKTAQRSNGIIVGLLVTFISNESTVLRYSFNLLFYSVFRLWCAPIFIFSRKGALPLSVSILEYPCIFVLLYRNTEKLHIRRRRWLTHQHVRKKTNSKRNNEFENVALCWLNRTNIYINIYTLSCIDFYCVEMNFFF